MPLFGSTYVIVLLIHYVWCFQFSKFILCQSGLIFMYICCMLVLALQNKYAHLFTVRTIHFRIRKTIIEVSSVAFYFII